MKLLTFFLLTAPAERLQRRPHEATASNAGGGGVATRGRRRLQGVLAAAKPS